MKIEWCFFVEKIFRRNFIEKKSNLINEYFHEKNNFNPLQMYRCVSSILRRGYQFEEKFVMVIVFFRRSIVNRRAKEIIQCLQVGKICLSKRKKN